MVLYYFRGGIFNGWWYIQRLVVNWGQIYYGEVPIFGYKWVKIPTYSQISDFR